MHEGTNHECPKCGIDCQHNANERQYFAYEALEEASQFFELDKTRGAAHLLNKTIVGVDCQAINQIILTCSDGKKFAIDTEAGPYQIPVIVVNKAE